MLCVAEPVRSVFPIHSVELMVSPFAHTIKELRERRGLSKPNAARAFGVSYRTLQDWESGSAARCIVDTLPRIYAALSLSLEEQDRLFTAWKQSDPELNPGARRKPKVYNDVDLDLRINRPQAFPEIAQLESITSLARDWGRPEVATKVLDAVQRIVDEAHAVLNKMGRGE